MQRSAFHVSYSFDDILKDASQVHHAEVRLFWDLSTWQSPDDLARALISVLSNELGRDVYIYCWGLV